MGDAIGRDQHFLGVDGGSRAVAVGTAEADRCTEADDFVVAGLVQNPSDGKPAPSVMAVVYVFNAQGEYFASGKAALEFAPLAPGAESPFVVRLSKTSGVTRFKVGFRALDGSVVAHVDHRGKPVDGTTGGSSPNNLPQSGGF